MNAMIRCIIGVLATVSYVSTLAADVISIGDKQFNRYEFRANTFSNSSQSQAALSIDSNDNIVSVWSSRRQQEGRYGIYAQRFTPDGIALGSETTINLWTDSHQVSPALASDELGGTWIAWQSHNQDGEAGSIIARYFDENFVGSSEIAINQQWRGHQSVPHVASTADGVAMIVWTSATSSKSIPRVYGRLFKPNGVSLGDEFAISYTCDQRETTPGIVAGSDGGFVVVFAVTDEQLIPNGIHMQRFSATGERVGDEVDVCSVQLSSQIEPAIATSGDGFIVTWLDTYSDGSDYGIMGRRFGHHGSPLGDSFVVNTQTMGPQTAAAVTCTKDGGFALAWNSSDGEGKGVFARLYDADGSPVDIEFGITRTIDGDQSLNGAIATQRFAIASDGSLLLAWNGDGGFDDSSGVNITMLAPNPLELSGFDQGVTDDMLPASNNVLLAGRPGPHIPPSFNPRDIEQGKREILEGADIGFTGIINTGWTPPDPHMAVGPEHVVIMTNGAIAFFTKDGNLTFQDEIEDSFGFWGSVGATGFVFDPEILYDELSGRFFAMAAEAFAPGGNSFVLIAVSDDSNPNGSWHKYRLSTTSLAGDLFDSPNISVDADTVYITGDGFGNGSNYSIFVYDKASMLIGNPPAQTNAFSMATQTQSAGIPPVSFDNPPALYMIEHREAFNNNNSVRLIALQNAFAAPVMTLFNLVVPSYGSPEDPPQSGTSNRPETFDARFWSVAFRNGSLWATHHVNPSQVRARWYEIAMNGWPDSGQNPTLVQSGEIDPGAGIRTFFSSITVSGNGNAAMTFARSSSNEFISMSTAYRLAGDPPGTFLPDEIAKISSGPYTFANRWGDYSAVQSDPADSQTFWANHEYHQNNSWRTWIQSFGPDAVTGDLDGDGSVSTADLLILLGSWGPCGDCNNCPADLDGSCSVGTSDLLLLLSNWG